MKKKYGLALFLLTLMLPLMSAQDQSTKSEKYHSVEGGFSFQIPDGWSQISASDIESFNRNQPEIYRFQSGFGPRVPSPTNSYMLLQVKRRPKTTQSKIDAARNAAIPIESVSMVENVIRKKEYKEKSEFYLAKHDSFLIIMKNGDRLSIAVKQFTDYGYYIMHFYLNNDLSDEIRKIETVLSTFTWDQKQEN